MLQCEACEASPGHYVAATENADRDNTSTIQRARVARYTWRMGHVRSGVGYMYV
jgi:hypothetical protein